MYHTRNSRDIREQEDAQPAPLGSPTTSGVQLLTQLLKLDSMSYLKKTLPQLLNKTSGDTPKKRNKRLQNIIKWSREEKKDNAPSY